MALNHTIHARTDRPGGPPKIAPGPRLLWWSARHPPENPTVRFDGKTVLITGANTGLGFEAAMKYAALGAAKLLLAVRSVDKGNAAKAKVVQETGFRTEDISILYVDLGIFASVQQFVKEVEKAAECIDVALLNAGVGPPSYQRSHGGWEMAVQVNVLSTALMGLLLLPKLRTTAKARNGGLVHMTFVNSIAHADVKGEWFQDKTLLTAANEEKSWDAQKSYGMVKLLGMAAMRGVADAAMRGPNGENIVVNACCPSLCKTDLGRDWGAGMKVVMAGMQAVFARSAEEGARTLVSASALDSNSSGKFWSHDVLYP
ncbi:MAG: hypothetical protein L6R41_000629 [Letrouitia leprolyta]|nr:MAG: hypothetical protein L6R41_000629 [Letrouitia leprolyta]